MLGHPNSGACDRLGIIASRKVGGAVQRNRAKRRVRDAFRHHLATPQSSPRFMDIVVIAKTSLVDAPHQDFMSEFHKALRRLRGVVQS